MINLSSLFSFYEYPCMSLQNNMIRPNWFFKRTKRHKFILYLHNYTCIKIHVTFTKPSSLLTKIM